MTSSRTHTSWWRIWLVSLAIWLFIGVAAGLSMYQFDRSMGKASPLRDEMMLPLIQEAIFGVLSPLIFLAARRWPLFQENWRRRLPLYILGALVFATAHITLRCLAYPVYDPRSKGYAYPIWNPHTRAFGLDWLLLQRVFLYNLLDDIVAAFVPVVVIAHALLYHERYKERETRAAQLQAQLARAHLATLKSQIQPHFLFNTLNSISALMHTDVRAADRMMSRLSDLLRLSLEDSGAQETTLNRELEFVKGYLEIERVRFADRLKVTFEVEPDVLEASVPHLLLQPITENAVKHGISKQSSQGEIRISASLEGNDLRVRVRDNGPGLSAASVPPNRPGLGLRATRDRLRTLYGENQHLDLHAAPGGGLEVDIRIPFRSESRPLLYGAEPAVPESVA